MRELGLGLRLGLGMAGAPGGEQHLDDEGEVGNGAGRDDGVVVPLP